MKQLHFHGYSDDTFGEYKTFNVDHDNCGNGNVIAFLLSSEENDEGLIIVGEYSASSHLEDMPGCWVIGIQQTEEGKDIPEWEIVFCNSDVPYSPLLKMSVPDDTVMTLLND